MSEQKSAISAAQWLFTRIGRRGLCAMALGLGLGLGHAGTAQGLFDLTINLTGFTGTQAQVFSQAETFWEDIVTGYQPNISLTGITIYANAETIDGVGGVLGQAGPTRSTTQGGYRLTTTGSMNFDSADINSLENNGKLIATITHEIGHILGIGTQWNANGVYTNGSGQYTGAYGVSAFQQEFSPFSNYVPVELTGGAGTEDSHWQETGSYTDSQGRPLSEELMSGILSSINYLSNTTTQSLRDIGFEVDGSSSSNLVTLSPGLTRTGNRHDVIGQLFTTEQDRGILKNVSIQRADGGAPFISAAYLHLYSDTDPSDGIDPASFMATSLNTSGFAPTDGGFSSWQFTGDLVLDSQTQYLMAFASSTTPGDLTDRRISIHQGGRGGSGYVGGYAVIDGSTQTDLNAIFQVFLELPTLIPGDVDLDGVVDHDDFGVLAFNFEPGTSGKTPTQGDLDDDGIVGLSDFGIVAFNFGNTDSPPPGPRLTVPEPASGLVLGVLTLLGIIRRRP